MADPDDELLEAVRDLTRTIEDLREELDSTRRRPRLRPPTPRELLAFTDEVALPVVLAALESSVRTLEAFRRGLELVRTEREVRDRASRTAGHTGDRATALRRTTLARLDDVLSELQRAASEGTLPTDEAASELLEEARRLRDDVDERLREATGESGSSRVPDADRDADVVEIDITEGTPDEPTLARDEPVDRESSVDVDAELETLKDRYGADADDGDGDREGDVRGSADRGDDQGPVDHGSDGRDVDGPGSDEGGTDAGGADGAGADRGGVDGPGDTDGSEDDGPGV